MYALFDGDTDRKFLCDRKGGLEAALIEGLVTDGLQADEEGGQINPAGYRAKRTDYDPQPNWKP